MTDLPENLTLVLAGIGFVLGGLVALFAIRVAARYFGNVATQEPPASLVAAISLIALVSLIGALVTNYESAWTITATGVGALAGSLTQWFTRPNDRPAEAGEEGSDSDDDNPPIVNL